MSEALDRAIVAAWNRGDLEEHARLTAVAARVARRRAEDRARATAALDRFIADLYESIPRTRFGCPHGGCSVCQASDNP